MPSSDEYLSPLRGTIFSDWFNSASSHRMLQEKGEAILNERTTLTPHSNYPWFSDNEYAYHERWVLWIGYPLRKRWKYPTSLKLYFLTLRCNKYDLIFLQIAVYAYQRHRLGASTGKHQLFFFFSK